MTSKSWNISQISLLSFYSMIWYTFNNITVRRLLLLCWLLSSFNQCLVPVTGTRVIVVFQIIETVMFGRVIDWVSSINHYQIKIKLMSKNALWKSFQPPWRVVFCRLWKLTRLFLSPLSLINKRSRKWSTNGSPLTWIHVT